MPHVITQACCNDASCVPVCPVNCIHPRPDEPDFATAEMLYIDPIGCIDCGACIPACPVSAIAPDDELTESQLPFLQINEDYFTDHPRIGLPPPKPAARRPEPLEGRRVAVVGAGAAALYAVDEIIKHPGVKVDVFDRLPTPYGLVRAGVSPDHASTKGVEKTYAKTLSSPAVRLFLNVEVGTDISVDELQERYDAVVLAYGASRDHRLGLDGEDLPGSLAATDIVAWYNGHPDHADDGPDLSGRRAVIIGNGNVALDVARILLMAPEALARTDIADHALAALRASTLEEVVVLGRRGIAQAAFTVGELVALRDLAGVDVHIDPDELTLDPASSAAEARGTLDSTVATKVRIARELASRAPRGSARRLVLRFLQAPVAVRGTDRVTDLELARTAFTDETSQKVELTGDVETMATDLVIRAVGYRGAGLPGAPFDEVSGTVPHRDGRAVDTGGSPIPGLYVTGWIKRGPTGGIGANRFCAADTVRGLIEDLLTASGPPRSHRADVADLLRERAVPFIDLAGWRRIDAAEKAAGAPQRRPRVKFVNQMAMTRVAHSGE